MDPSPRSRRRWLPWVAAAGVSLLVLAVVGAIVYITGRGGDVSHPNVEFHAQGPPTLPRQPTSPADARFEWPLYGYDKARTRYLPLRRDLHPPYREAWKIGGRTLLEFPPVLSARSLFYLKNDGAVVAAERASGRVRWRRKIGSLAASSPAVAHDTVYAVLLQRFRGSNGGRVVALSARDGHTRWSRKLPSRAESSPLLDAGRLYFGTEDGTVYALRARDGSLLWRFRADGAVKGGIATSDGKLFFGDYAGKVYALRKTNGSKIWSTTTSGAHFGFSAGQFYSTPAVAYGRVFLGNTDGFVYSFAQDSGKLAWRTQTGGYVYGSPAVAQLPGGRPTVYIGSYDGRFYALDARSGRKRWVHRAEGKISGGATVIGDMVWYSTLSHTTTALGVGTGRVLYRTRRGAFNPVVSDGTRIYLVGYTSLYALAPVHRVAHRRPPALHRRFRLPGRAVVCFRSHGHQACRHRVPAVCFRVHGKLTCHARKQAPAARLRLPHRRLRHPRAATVCFKLHGRTHCRQRKPTVCFQGHGHLTCHAQRRRRRR